MSLATIVWCTEYDCKGRERDSRTKALPTKNREMFLKESNNAEIWETDIWTDRQRKERNGKGKKDTLSKGTYYEKGASA